MTAAAAVRRRPSIVQDVLRAIAGEKADAFADAPTWRELSDRAYGAALGEWDGYVAAVGERLEVPEEILAATVVAELRAADRRGAWDRIYRRGVN